jgi:transcriptional regulator
MYIPKHFEQTDKKKLVEFMREYNFAAIVSSAKKRYWATHIPFLVEETGGEVILRAHMAKANPQWANFKNEEEILVIFQEPHSYNSPSLYDNPVSVPTWNYLAVHAYGIPKILPSLEDRIKMLEDTFKVFEPKFKEQWDTLREITKAICLTESRHLKSAPLDLKVNSSSARTALMPRERGLLRNLTPPGTM